MPNAATAPARSLLSVTDVADLLRVSKTSIYRLVERRELPVYRLAGALRFAREDVDALLERARVASRHEQPGV